eukprot:10144560-Alexandrium_andersonii.AAC.1
MGHPNGTTLAKMIYAADGSGQLVRRASRYPRATRKRYGGPRLRRSASVPRTREFNDTLLVDVHYWKYRDQMNL